MVGREDVLWRQAPARWVALVLCLSALALAPLPFRAVLAGTELVEGEGSKEGTTRFEELADTSLVQRRFEASGQCRVSRAMAAQRTLRPRAAYDPGPPGRQGHLLRNGMRAPLLI